MQLNLGQILVTGVKLTFVAVSEIIFQSRSMSWSVVYCDVTVNLMTYLPFKDAGTMWTFPDLFNLFKSVSVISFSPWSKNKLMYYLKIITILFDMFWITICSDCFLTHNRNTTIPKTLEAGISNLWSFLRRSSNLLAKRTPCNGNILLVISRNICFIHVYNTQWGKFFQLFWHHVIKLFWHKVALKISLTYLSNMLL